MKLLRESEVPGAGRAHRYSQGWAVAAAVLVLAGAAALVVVGRPTLGPVAYVLAAVMLLVLWMYSGMIRARFRSTNWLVRTAADGLYVKFRSYLNHHFAGDEPTVAFIPYREIRRARLVRETHHLPDSDRRGTTTRRHQLVELELREDAPELDAALAAERRAKGPSESRWYGSTSSRYRHYPVRMPSPRLVEIEWGVVPGAGELLRVLAPHTGVDTLVVVRDDARLKALSRPEQERRLLELAERGETLAAVAIARTLYGYDIAEAKRFVDGLVGRARS